MIDLPCAFIVLHPQIWGWFVWVLALLWCWLEEDYYIQNAVTLARVLAHTLADPWVCMNCYAETSTATALLIPISSCLAWKLYPFWALELPASTFCYTISKLSKFLHNSFLCHFAAADQTIVYLHGTKMLTIQFSANIDEKQVFICISDAAFDDDMST